MRLNLGCGSHILAGYVNCDLYAEQAELRCDAKVLPFETGSIDEIYSSHLIEHFDFKEGFEVLREWNRVLKQGGVLIIETPDLLASCKKFVDADEQTRIGLYGHFFAMPWQPGNWHKFVYTENQLRWTLEQTGFKNMRRERALLI